MKFIYSILALAAAITVSNAQITDCVSLVCIKEGERCDQDYFNFTNPDSVNANCEYGTFCQTSETATPVCVRELGFGETCGNANPWAQCGAPYTCVGSGISTCGFKNYLGFGESCNTELQCIQGLECVDGACGRLPNVNCQSDTQCPSGQWCNLKSIENGEYNPNACVDWSISGGECQEDSQCAYDHYCDGTTNTCQVNFGKGSGDACNNHGASVYNAFTTTRYECGAGLYCNGATCVEAPTVPTGSCINGAANCNTQLTGSFCQCESQSNIDAGACTAATVSYSGACQTSINQIAQCAIENKCPALQTSSLGSYGTESCIFKNCGDLMCASACNIELSSNLQCGDYVPNAFCKLPSSSSIVLPSFVILIFALIALLF